MPRPKRLRRITSRPDISRFSPRGASSRGEIRLSLDEFEAIRLIDYQGMDQSQAAEIMEVSRQTVGRVLRSGRSKLATAIVEGLHLKVGGGSYRIQGNDRCDSGLCTRGRGRGRGRRHQGKPETGKNKRR